MSGVDLSSSSISELRDRFSSLFDAVVQGVELRLWPSPGAATLRILAKDSQSSTGWSLVTFELSGIEEYRLEASERTSFTVLSHGVQFVFENDLTYLVLDPYPEHDDGLPDLRENLAYLASQSCSWTAHEYPVD